MATPYGRQQRERERREARAQMAAVSTGSLYMPPENGCVESRQQVELEDPDFRLDMRLVNSGDKLVEYAVVLSRRWRGGDWDQVYMVDTLHGTLHEHLSGHHQDGDSREIRPLYTQVDVQESLDDPATLMVLEKYRKMRS